MSTRRGLRLPAGLHDDSIVGRVYDTRMIRRLWEYVKPHRALVALSLALMIAVSAAQLVQPWLVMVAIDEHIRTGDLGGLAWIAGLFLLALTGEFLLRYAQLYVLEWTGQNVVYDLRTTVFAHLQRLPSSFFDRNPIGRLMTRVTSDVEAINEAFASGLVMMLADLFKLAVIVAILLWMDWRLALVAFAIVPPMIALSWFFRLRLRQIYRDVRRLVARLNAFLQENVTGMRLVQLFGRERQNLAEFERLNRDHRDAELSAVAYDSSFSSVAELVASITLAAIVWAGGWRLLAAAITFGTLVAFIEYAGKFFQPVQQLSQRFAVMQAAMASAERIFGVLDVEPSIRSPEAPRALPGRPRGEIAFEDVTFAYNEGEPVLRDISLEIRPGERVAVVGWTGSGKTTLIRLLVRLYDVQDGRIRLDGVDIRELAVPDLRRAVGVVLQEPFLFSGTIGDNITLGDERIDGEKVRRALELTGAQRFVSSLPGGLDEEVKERGSNLSVGERQMISFARALAFDPAVLILDEATASVDPETEQALQYAMSTLMHGRTSIVIAHRLATVRDADRILVLHKGRLVEQGTHDELLAKSDGIYRTLYTLQAAG
ncbi:MAG: ABC transporter ATP-binding protein/permease [Acidobacteriota bacterium]|nr:ABC transporter ATP-binding protein/permease [Acidobacteriota bacterium]